MPVSQSVSDDGGVDGTRDPGGGFGDEAIEESARGGADVVAAFRMPLNAEDEVGGGAFGGLSAFDGFDDGILRAAGGDAKAVAGDADGLVMAGVDGETEEVALLRRFVGCKDGAEEGFGCDGSGMGNGDITARGVIHGEDVQVLN